MLPRLCGVKMDECTLCCDTNTMIQSPSCSRTAAMMNNTHLLPGHQTCESHWEPTKTKAGSWLSALKQMAPLFAFLKGDFIWQDVLCLCSVEVWIWCHGQEVSWAWYSKHTERFSVVQWSGSWFKLRTVSIAKPSPTSIHCNIGDSIQVILLKRMERPINWMSYSAPRDAITCSSYIEIDCHGLYNWKKPKISCGWVCVGRSISVRRGVKGLHNSLHDLAKMPWVTLTRENLCACTCMEMYAANVTPFSNHSAHYWVFLSLQIQFHSATANFRCSLSRMQHQPISIEQTEIGNSLPCIDPVTLKLDTQHRELPTKLVYVCVFVCFCTW